MLRSRHLISFSRSYKYDEDTRSLDNNVDEEEFKPLILNMTKFKILAINKGFHQMEGGKNI